VEKLLQSWRSSEEGSKSNITKNNQDYPLGHGISQDSLKASTSGIEIKEDRVDRVDTDWIGLFRAVFPKLLFRGMIEHAVT